MKKCTEDRRRHQLIRQGQLRRWLKRNKWANLRESSRKNSSRKSKPRKILIAPQHIDLYRKDNYEALCSFLIEFRSAASQNSGVIVSFRNTETITAAGGILFLSEVDRAVTKYGRQRVKAIRPPSTTAKHGRKIQLVESILNQIGFFTLLGDKNRNCPTYHNVECWRSAQGIKADGQVAGELLNTVPAEFLDQDKLKGLYRGVIEALSNSVEHAYPSGRSDGRDALDRRWWMFTAITESALVVLVCDLGVGIPVTIKNTQPRGFLQHLLSMVRLGNANDPDNATDADLIEAATLVKRTRTAKTHRGLGGSDLRQLVEGSKAIPSTKNSGLSIYSNKGRFRLYHRDGTGITSEKRDHRNSILGTIVEWSIEVNV